jgi:16S rRNA G966 N2-methylase RsmD
MLVTTSYDPTEEQEARAKEAARVLKAVWVPRGRHTLEQLKARHGDPSLLLVSKERMEYHQEEQPPLFFHPSMASIRIKRLLNGETDALLKVSGVQKGDVVLDCTAGLGSDSIVFSYAVGQEGSITALESEPVLYYLVKDGLSRYESDVEALNRAMRRIRLIQADHAAYLKQAPDNSVDIIYFDPMFRHPVNRSNAIGPIRNVANDKAIQPQTVQEARRVARRAIVMKERRKSREFERLGFQETVNTSTNIAYGVIRF